MKFSAGDTKDLKLPKSPASKPRIWVLPPLVVAENSVKCEGISVICFEHRGFRSHQFVSIFVQF